MPIISYITAEVTIFFLIGCCVGAHYGLDGWIGATEVRSLKDSPRLKNFRWVIGVGLFTFVADLKTLGIQGDRKYAVLAYLLGFVAVALLVISSIAIIIHFRCRTFKAKEPEKYPNQPYTPVMDYVLYGYQYHRKRFDDGVQKKTAGQVQESIATRKHFLPEYAKQMAYSIMAVQTGGDAPSAHELTFPLVQVLRIIKGVVLEYHHKEKPRINVNVMIAYSRSGLPPELKTKIRFAYGNHHQYSHYLSIAAYADEDGKEDFVLPVENVEDLKNAMSHSLPGAPMAFLKKTYETVDDTQNIQFSKSLPANLKKELVEYFKTKDFKSFGCISITGRNATQLGILVIESDNKYVFGRTDKNKSELNLLLQPYALLTGNLITAIHRLRST